jgi:hypothetical protein
MSEAHALFYILTAISMQAATPGEGYEDSCKAALHAPYVISHQDPQYHAYRDSSLREPAEGDAYSDSRAVSEDAPDLLGDYP